MDAAGVGRHSAEPLDTQTIHLTTTADDLAQLTNAAERPHRAPKWPRIATIALSVCLAASLVLTGILVWQITDKNDELAGNKEQVSALQDDLSELNATLTTTENDLAAAQSLILKFETCSQGVLRSLQSTLRAVSGSTLTSYFALLRASRQLTEVQAECRGALSESNDLSTT